MIAHEGDIRRSRLKVMSSVLEAIGNTRLVKRLGQKGNQATGADECARARS
jgi:hypothetical protein